MTDVTLGVFGVLAAFLCATLTERNINKRHYGKAAYFALAAVGLFIISARNWT